MELALHLESLVSCCGTADGRLSRNRVSQVRGLILCTRILHLEIGRTYHAVCTLSLGGSTWLIARFIAFCVSP